MSYETLRKVIVASVGHSWERVFRAVAGVGVGEGDTVLLFNSYPQSREAVDAMNKLFDEITKRFLANVKMFWLDPRKGFEDSVAEIRRAVEEYAPCKAFFLAVGGFRWLALAVSFAALALNTGYEKSLC